MKRIYGTTVKELLDIESFFHEELHRDIRLCSTSKGPYLKYSRKEKHFILGYDGKEFIYNGLVEAYIRWAEVTNDNA